MTCNRPRAEARWENVVLCAARGDQVAIDELLDELRPRLALYCRAQLRERREVAGVLESTLADVVAALPGMSERRAPFPGWAYGLAAQRVRAANDDGDVRIAQEFLENLGPRQRAIVAGEMQGLRTQELAAAVCMSLHAVRTVRGVLRQRLASLSGGGRTSATMRVVRELLRDGDVADLVGARTDEDRAEEGDLDLAAARSALLADLRATLPGHDVLTPFEVADREADAALDRTVR